MRGASSLRATGKVTGAALTTTIAGIGTVGAIPTAIAIATSAWPVVPWKSQDHAGQLGPGILCFGAF
jgi:hypothetical protein